MKFCVFTVLCLATLAAGHKVQILDETDADIGTIAEQVCWHKQSHKQISKVSTVGKVAAYLESLPAEHKLAACARLYLTSVKELNEILGSSNDNACSADKIAQIERFHRAYLLKASQSADKAPKVIKNFFYHYVHLVSNLCATESAHFLQNLETPADLDEAKVDQVFVKMSEQTGVASSASLHYKDVFLMWSLINMLPLKSQTKIEAYLFDGPKRLVVQAKNPDSLRKMQESCRQQSRPLYSHSLLSAIKLIHLGYYPRDSNLLEVLNNNKQARRLYEMTKVCETVLPIQVVDGTGAESKVLNHEQVQSLGVKLESEPESSGSVCEKCSVADVELLPTVTAESAVFISRQVKADIAGRKSAISTLLKIFLRRIKSSISGGLREMFGLNTVESIDNTTESQIDQLEVYESSEDDAAPTTGLKSKRSGGLGDVISVIFQAILFVAFLPIFLILLPFTLFASRD